MRPGEVYRALDDSGKPRRFIVVSREELNRGDYVLVVPVTGANFETRRSLRNCVPLHAGQFGFTKDCVAQAELTISIDKTLLMIGAGPVGKLDDEAMRALIRAIGYVIESQCEPD